MCMKDTNQVKRKVVGKIRAKKSSIPQFPSANGSGTYSKSPEPAKFSPPKKGRIGQFPGVMGTNTAISKASAPTKSGRKTKTIPQYAKGKKGMMGSRGSDR